MDSTQLIYGVALGLGTLSVIFSIMRTAHTSKINSKLDQILMTMYENQAPRPVQPQIQQQPYQAPIQQQYVPQQPQMPVQQPVIPQQMQQPQQISATLIVPNLKPMKQDFAQRVKDMQEGKTRARLARELAAKQAELNQMQ